MPVSGRVIRSQGAGIIRVSLQVSKKLPFGEACSKGKHKKQATGRPADIKRRSSMLFLQGKFWRTGYRPGQRDP